jgi:hypothetical protein
MLIHQPDVSYRVHVAVTQDRTSADRDSNTVLLLAESDPIGPVDFGGERVEAPRAALARPKCVNNLDAAPLEDLPQWQFQRNSRETDGATEERTQL